MIYDDLKHSLTLNHFFPESLLFEERRSFQSTEELPLRSEKLEFEVNLGPAILRATELLYVLYLSCKSEGFG